MDFGDLTLLCGGNGTGKSSVIQALLLLRQSHIKNRLEKVLDLNKPLCEIGTAGDALYQSAEGETVAFRITDSNDREYAWEFEAEKIRIDELSFLKANRGPERAERLNLNLFGPHFHYVGAERLGPQALYGADNYAVEVERQLSIEKGRGELVAHYLDHYGKKPVMPGLLHSSTPETDLLTQAGAWEREISVGIRMDVKQFAKNMYKIEYFYETKHGISAPISPNNVGFGVSYTLPVVVAALSTEPGGLLIVENPEAHLHPKSQAKLAVLLTSAARNGIQVVIETHSDHILNGVLVACKRHEENPETGVNKQNVRIYQFERNEESLSSNCTEVKVLPHGKLDRQPEGFFDQIETDMTEIMGF